ncbi:MAG: hypothetical protein KDE46_07090 [Caldilineaceae bacterium]|nr:hypothetical protein [Caldilineaceae bacterium]
MTTNATFSPVPDHLIAAANQIDLIELAGRYTELRKKSVNEYCGPCPKCGGNDRFVVQADKFFCRNCHSGKWQDAIAFERWIGGVSFGQAVSNLTGVDLPDAKPMPRTAPIVKRKPARLSTWNAGAKARLLASLQDNLLADVGKPGRAYLEGERALLPATWRAYGLGFHPDANGLGPAIAMPWYKAGRLVAIRYRYIHLINGKREVRSETGSIFEGHLFGGQALLSFVAMPPDEGRKNGEWFRTLVLFEGELNAMSAHQIAHHTGVDVLSVGSQSASIPSGIIAIARRYGAVFAWFDEPALAAAAAVALPGCHAISSPNGQDANNLLQAGWLGGFLAAARLKGCQGNAEKIERLKWDLWDGAQTEQGIDAGAQSILDELM